MNYSNSLTFSTRANNAMVSYLEYLRKTIWPEKLFIFYPHPENSLVVWQGILCGIALLGITIISIRLIRKKPYFAVGWFWYLGTLVPVIGFVGYGTENGTMAMADRYAYIPLIGIFIIIAWGVPELIPNWRYKEKMLSASAGTIILLLIITTWKQVGHWKNSFTLLNYAIRSTDKKYPSLGVIHNHLGLAYYAQAKIEEAISNYKMAIKVNPNHAMAYYNLGIATFAKNNNEEAIFHYKMAIRINPEFTNAYFNLGVVLFQKGKIKEAAHYFGEALRLKPDLIVARDYLEFVKIRLQ